MGSVLSPQKKILRYKIRESIQPKLMKNANCQTRALLYDDVVEECASSSNVYFGERFDVKMSNLLQG